MKKYYLYNKGTHQYLGEYDAEDNMLVKYGWFIPFIKEPLAMTLENWEKEFPSFVNYSIEEVEE
ncbi:hypothetical protein [Lactobacillus terrae]|uniref:hypothetical protein n=1 Tax=Lactobacillus terrae TaxID=2269374 RepID=UPI000C1B7338|nr:hypothetical protein [Lactobacillus terrae]